MTIYGDFMAEAASDDAYKLKDPYSEATKAIHKAATTTFEANVVKARTSGGLNRRKLYGIYVQDFKSSGAPISMPRQALWAFAFDAMKDTPK